MSLREQRFFKSATIHKHETPNKGVIDVLWVDQILRGDIVIGESNFRDSFTRDRKEEFISAVEDSEHFIKIVGWGEVDSSVPPHGEE